MVTEKQRTNRCRAVGGLLGLGLAGAFAAPASAESANQPVNDIALSATVRHDSNIARSIISSGNTHASDERATIGAELTITRPVGRNTISANAFIGYDFYRRNTRLNRERISVAVDAAVNVGPCLVRLTPSFSRRQSDYADLQFLNVPGIDSVRNVQTEQNYATELRCGNPNGFRPLVRYARGIGNNSSPLRQFSNYHSDTYAAGLGYNNVVLGNYDLTVSRTDLDYPNRPAIFSNGYQRDEIGITGSRDIGSILVAHASLAYTNLKPKTAVVPGFKGISWSVGATAIPIPALRLQATWAQSVNPSLGTNALYSRDRNIDLAATYALSERTSVTLSASRTTRVYRGDGAVLGPLLTDDRRDRISGEVSFTPSQRLRLSLEATHERRNANGTLYDYKNTFIALTARFSLGSP